VKAAIGGVMRDRAAFEAERCGPRPDRRGDRAFGPTNERNNVCRGLPGRRLVLLGEAVAAK
jgi:hypothetical protein